MLFSVQQQEKDWINWNIISKSV